MRYMDADTFVADCLQYVDEVCATRETIVVLKDGRPFVHVAPMPEQGTRASGAPRSPEPSDLNPPDASTHAAPPATTQPSDLHG